ncbi:MAG: hypothetical protein OTI34_12255 [Lewinella sp.]|nr:hypothetical protein [Lewinella sp.]
MRPFLYSRILFVLVVCSTFLSCNDGKCETDIISAGELELLRLLLEDPIKALSSKSIKAIIPIVDLKEPNFLKYINTLRTDDMLDQHKGFHIIDNYLGGCDADQTILLTHNQKWTKGISNPIIFAFTDEYDFKKQVKAVEKFGVKSGPEPWPRLPGFKDKIIGFTNFKREPGRDSKVEDVRIFSKITDDYVLEGVWYSVEMQSEQPDFVPLGKKMYFVALAFSYEKEEFDIKRNED